jgi:hypothetical protein
MVYAGRGTARPARRNNAARIYSYWTRRHVEHIRNFGITESRNHGEGGHMALEIDYPHLAASGAPLPLRDAAIWAVALRLRRAVLGDATGGALDADVIATRTAELVINGRPVTTSWDFAHAVHDALGRPVLGVCETDPDAPGMAYVSVNREMVAHRPDIALSTAAHELGHVVLDVPCALGRADRRYRSVTTAPDALVRSANASERRANEFMGALLVPPVALHTRLLALARAERMRLVRAPHHGRPASPVLAGDNAPDAIAGIIAVIAGEFGVSDSFIAVRMARYRLVAGGGS